MEVTCKVPEVHSMVVLPLMVLAQGESLSTSVMIVAVLASNRATPLGITRWCRPRMLRLSAPPATRAWQ